MTSAGSSTSGCTNRATQCWPWSTNTRLQPGEVVVTVRQEQNTAWPTFRLPMAIEVTTDGSAARVEVEMLERVQTFRIAAPHEPISVVLDPEGWVLKQVAGEDSGEGDS